MPLPDFYSHEEFMQDYECVVDKEFELDGKIASWAPSQTGPRMWDQEDVSIDVSVDVRNESPESSLALTPDDKYLAVAVNAKLRLYNVETLQICADLPEHEHDVESLSFQPRQLSESSNGEIQYVLVFASAKESQIYTLRFGSAGQCLDGAFAAPSLLAEGVLPSFGSRIWGHHSNRLIYIANPRTAVPDVAVLDMLTGKEVCRLAGHKDAIVWVSWSPDDTSIATASWDGTYSIWVAISGVRRHTIGPTSGQNWSGAFLGDETHILLSGAAPHQVGIYNTATAALVTSLQPPDGIELDEWMRHFAVHPSRDLIVLQNRRTLLAWTPFESFENGQSVQVILALQSDEYSMAGGYGGLHTIKWVDRGRKVVVQSEDHTIFVWEPKKAYKWRFQRPKGRGTPGHNGTDVLYLRRKGQGWVVSMGENKIRFWKL